jgi:hypothetical protein
MANKLAAFLEHVCKVRGMNFQENRSDRSQTTAGNYISLQVKCPYFWTDRNQKFIIRSAFLESAMYKISGKFSNGSRDTDKRVFFPPSNVPLMRRNNVYVRTVHLVYSFFLISTNNAYIFIYFNNIL